MISNEKLKTLLSGSGLVDQARLQNAIQSAQSKNLDLADAIIDQGIITDEKLGQHIAQSLKLPFIVVSKTTIEKQALQVIPQEIAQNHHTICFALTSDEIKIATNEPENTDLIANIHKKTSKKVVVHYATKRDIIHALSLYKNTSSNKLHAIVVKRNSIECFNSGKKQSIIIKLDEKIFDNLEVVNPYEFEKVITQELFQIGWNKLQTTVFLSDEVLYSKQGEAKPEAVKEFLSNIPLALNRVHSVTPTTGSAQTTYVVDTIVVQALHRALSASSIQCQAIYPQSFIISLENFENQLNKIPKKTLEEGNFLTTLSLPQNTKPLSQSTSTVKVHHFSKAGLLLIAMLICVLTLTGIIVQYNNTVITDVQSLDLQNISYRFNKAHATIIPQSSITPSPDSTSSAQESSPQTTVPLSALIINKSGKLPLSISVRDKLDKIGIQRIETETSKAGISIETIVTFSPEVPSQTRKEIVTMLKELFIEVVEGEIAAENPTDITINTGKEK